LKEQVDSLASRLKTGDRQAAGELVDIYYKQLYLFMRRLGHNRQTSEDLTQDIFIQAWQHIGRLKDGGALNGWIYRIAGNASKHYWRKNKDKKAVGIECVDEPYSRENSFDNTEHNEQLGRLKIAVAGLSIKLKESVVLHYMQQLTIAEAAEAAGIREGTFKSRLNRALRALRKQLDSKSVDSL